MKRVWCLIALAAASLASGCSPPPATTELLAVTRKALADARQDRQRLHEQLVAQWAARSGDLDAAFDRDVRQVAAGQLARPDGSPVPFTPDWVIAARQGYAAARDALHHQQAQAQAAHAVQLDNLQAADEALGLANEMILRQQGLGLRIGQHLLNLQRRFFHD